MDIYEREFIGANIRHELRKGTHTYTMCECGRNSCRGGRCWECLLSILVKGKSSKKNDALVEKGEADGK